MKWQAKTESYIAMCVMLVLYEHIVMHVSCYECRGILITTVYKLVNEVIKLVTVRDFIQQLAS